MNISIIICTFNRERLLHKCLGSLVNQIKFNTEILVIDNNSQDDTQKVTESFMQLVPTLRYITEPTIGLSHARNRGIKESKADWILYIDDDAIAFPDLVERALYLVDRGDFDCVGGTYYGYFDGEKPKWIPEYFCSKVLYSKDLTECPYFVPTGGVVLYRKLRLIDVGMFNINFGMKGKYTGYGEEAEIQKRMNEAGYKIGFDPNFKIYHLVRSEKMNFIWQFKSSFFEGRDSCYKYTKKGVLFNVIKSIGSVILKGFPRNFIKLIFDNNYYWQNFILETFHPIIRTIGMSYSKFIMKLKY